MSFGGTGAGWSWSSKAHSGSTSLASALQENIKKLSARLDGVCIECKDWREIIAGYDYAEAFFFFDPPYLTKTGNHNYAPWGLSEMQALGERLNTVQGNWVLTVDACPACHKIFKRWHIKKITSRSTCAPHGKGDGKIRELIIRKQRW